MKKTGRPITDMIGKKFNRLTVIEQMPEKDYDGSIRWMCRCDCGRMRVHSGTRLRQNKTQSCGCVTGETSRARLIGKTRNKHHSWRGHGEISLIRFRKIKDGAIYRNKEFNITIEQIWELFLKQNRKCAFSGVTLEFNQKSNIYNGSASLDRIDSSKGYTIDNIQWIHKDLQHAKMSMSDQQFFKWVKTIYEYQCLDTIKYD